MLCKSQLKNNHLFLCKHHQKLQCIEDKLFQVCLLQMQVWNKWEWRSQFRKGTLGFGWFEISLERGIQIISATLFWMCYFPQWKPSICATFLFYCTKLGCYVFSLFWGLDSEPSLKIKVEKWDCRLIHLNFSWGISSTSWLSASMRSRTKVSIPALSRTWVHREDDSDARWQMPIWLHGAEPHNTSWSPFLTDWAENCTPCLSQPVFLVFFLLAEGSWKPSCSAVGLSPLSLAVSEITLSSPVPYSLPRELAWVHYLVHSWLSCSSVFGNCWGALNGIIAAHDVWIPEWCCWSWWCCWSNFFLTDS